MWRRTIVMMAVIITFLGCNQTKQADVSTTENSGQTVELKNQGLSVSSDMKSQFQPFDIYTDKGSRNNHFIPSGFMPNGKCLSLEDAWTEGCRSGKTCIKVVYDVECSRQDQKWAGIYWLNPPNNWGNRKGGFDLTGAKKLTFWAKGQKGGEHIEEFKMGGILGSYPDSDMAIIGPVILTDNWRQYTIDLRGKDLSYISGGFSWSTNIDFNLEECTFYLDDLQYE